MAVTGVPYFVDSEIPSAVFLGLHLLVTDPSTSPRTPLGRAIFGVLYGARRRSRSTRCSAPSGCRPSTTSCCACRCSTCWCRPSIARCATSASVRCSARWGSTGPLGRGNLAHMAVWVVFFGAMTALGAHRRHAPRRRAAVLAAGVRREPAAGVRAAAAASKRRTAATTPAGPATSWAGTTSRAGWCPPIRIARSRYFSRACEARFQAGCVNLLDAVDAGQRRSAAARPAAAAARRRAQPARHARARAVRARLPSWLELRVREGVGVAVTPIAVRHCVARVRRRSRASSPAWLPAPAAADRAATPIRACPPTRCRTSSEMPAGPFIMGAEPAAIRGLRQRALVADAGEGTVDLPDVLHRAHTRSPSAQFAAFAARPPAGRSIRSADAAPPASSGDASSRGPKRWPTAAGSKPR